MRDDAAVDGSGSRNLSESSGRSILAISGLVELSGSDVSRGVGLVDRVRDADGSVFGGVGVDDSGSSLPKSSGRSAVAISGLDGSFAVGADGDNGAGFTGSGGDAVGKLLDGGVEGHGSECSYRPKPSGCSSVVISGFCELPGGGDRCVGGLVD